MAVTASQESSMTFARARRALAFDRARRWRGALLLLGAALALASCESSSKCGGSSGYEVNDLQTPLLASCTSTAATTSSAGSTTDVTNTAMVSQNIGVNTNAYLGTFYPMPAVANSGGGAVMMPTPGTAATLTFQTGPVHAVAGTNDYTLTASASGYTLYCDVQGGTETYFDTTYAFYSEMTSTTATLRVNYPTFTGTGSFTLECVGKNSGGGTTNLATLVVDFP
jgi:hypothetical protein